MRPFERRPFPSNRRFVLAAMRAGRQMSPMTAMVKVDVTDAWSRLRRLDLSPTAFFIAGVGRAAAEHPEVHAYRDWLGRLVMHRHVGVMTMVEVETETGSFPLALPMAGTDVRTVSDLSAELRAAKTQPESKGSGRLLMRWGKQAGRVPGLAGAMYFVVRRWPRARSRVGTVALSSVGMMTGGGGFVIGVPTISSLTVLVGGVTEQPWVVDGEVAVRHILDLVIQIDHKVVDGAPAARFGARLREILEHPDLVDW